MPGENPDRNFAADLMAEAPEILDLEIIELLGKGGNSLVYKARQKQLDRIVAVKVLSRAAIAGEHGKKRFQNESKLTSMLEHPNIVQTFYSGLALDGQPYLVMEYLEGMSLSTALTQQGRLNLQIFKEIFLPALSALGQAHQAGLVHRDIKPGNIMICHSNTGVESVKLVDFGIAKLFADNESDEGKLTKTGTAIGSPVYMSPEQCQGKPMDGRSDLYSLACVMYEALCGEPPFSADAAFAVMQKHCSESPGDLLKKVKIDKELGRVILWGLNKDPAARPQTAAEFAGQLSEALGRMTLDKVPVLRTGRQTRINKYAIYCLLALVLAGMLALLNSSMHQDTRQQLRSVASHHDESKDLRAEQFMRSEQITLQKLIKADLNNAQNHDQEKDHEQTSEIRDRGAALVTKQRRAKKLEDAEHTLTELIQYCQRKRLEEPACLGLRIDLAELKNERKDYTAALKIYSEELSELQKQGQEETAEARKIIHHQAASYIDQKHYVKAASLLQHLLAIQERVLGPEQTKKPEQLSKSTTIHLVPGKSVPKTGNYFKVLTTDDGKFGEKAETLYMLAKCHLFQGKPEEAVPLLKRSLAIWDSEAPTGSTYKPFIHRDLNALAESYLAQGKYNDAEPVLQRSKAILEKAPDPDHSIDLPVALKMLADCYRQQGRSSEAKQLEKQARAIHDKAS